MKHPYRVEVETSPEPCGFDFESFIGGYYCKSTVKKVIIEDKDFHFAHLCDEHTDKVMTLLNEMGLTK